MLASFPTTHNHQKLTMTTDNRNKFKATTFLTTAKNDKLIVGDNNHFTITIPFSVATQ
jgi:hypothetical protein